MDYFVPNVAQGWAGQPPNQGGPEYHLADAVIKDQEDHEEAARCSQSRLDHYGDRTAATAGSRTPRGGGGRGGLAHVSGGVAVSTRTKNTFVDVGGPSAACQRRTLRRNATDGDDPMQQDPATRVSAAASSSSGPPVAQALVVVTPPPTGSDVSGWASGMSNSGGASAT